MALSAISLIFITYLVAFSQPTPKNDDAAVLAPKNPKILSQKKPSEVIQAQKAFESGDYKTAENLYWKNIENLSLIDLRYLMRSSEKNQHFEEVLKSANLILAQNEKDEEALTAIGRYHSRRTSQKNSNQLAIDHFKQAIESNSKYQPAYEALIQHYENRMAVQERLKQSKQKNYYELRILYQDMLSVFGERADHLTALCRINSLDAQLDQAQETCLKAIQKDKNSAEPYVYLGKAYEQAQDAENARKYLSTAAQKFPESKIAQIGWGNYLENQKNYIQAFKAFSLATQADSKSGDAWRGVGRTALQINKYEESFSAFRKACGLDPKSSATDLRRAVLLSKDKRSKLSSLIESCR